MYFDEAHTLSVEAQPGSCHKRSAYHNLGKVLTWLRMDPICFLFLSTQSKLRAFAPTIYEHPSVRDWTYSTLLPPYTELPYDVFAEGMVSRLRKDKSLTLEGVCKVKELVRFGRPLLVTLSFFSSWCIHIDF